MAGEDKYNYYKVPDENDEVMPAGWREYTQFNPEAGADQLYWTNEPLAKAASGGGTGGGNESRPVVPGQTQLPGYIQAGRLALDTRIFDEADRPLKLAQVRQIDAEIARLREVRQELVAELGVKSSTALNDVLMNQAKLSGWYNPMVWNQAVAQMEQAQKLPRQMGESELQKGWG